MIFKAAAACLKRAARAGGSGKAEGVGLKTAVKGGGSSEWRSAALHRFLDNGMELAKSIASGKKIPFAEAEEGADKERDPDARESQDKCWKLY